MADEVRKISFGFSKSVKKPVLKNTVQNEKKKIDYIECLDEKAIKVIGLEDKKEDEPLVIPMRGSKTWHDRIVNKIDADIFEPKVKTNSNGDMVDIVVKKEPIGAMDTDEADIKPVQSATIKQEVKAEESKLPNTLEEQAAQEILQDLHSTETNGNDPSIFSLPVKDAASLAGEQESTLEDYESIPIDAYGMAMLRGMGWKPGKGIGKNEKLVEASIPALRPKGMGLGADKVTMQKQNSKPRTKEEEELKLIKGAFVKLIAGKQKDSYGQIEGLDDDAGRFIVKMALGGNVVSVNESVVQAVTKEEYLKNGKVLNSAKYQEYKDKDTDNTGIESRLPIVESLDGEREERRGRKENKEHDESITSGKRKMKKSRRRSSSDDSSPDCTRKRNDSDSSEVEKKPKKSKKSKKHRNRDSSAERSSRKNRKKDKEREKRKDRRCSESPERRKRKKHKRSRSRSPRK
ncbi:G-patch domain and KOW motifs-containing protein isoform X1 [Neodiprion fabricii]|uniref:G-patch domain and KOW motifs-containing protein isoform X1 n=1 Tax=Neodiprion fabricii TaxID=2872261 RepID=UPI001ED97BE5|nr:G-patch domain and KOW motifs-containing protein isoform X1 [Neodiprion fabricii]